MNGYRVIVALVEDKAVFISGGEIIKAEFPFKNQADASAAYDDAMAIVAEDLNLIEHACEVVQGPMSMNGS